MSIGRTPFDPFDDETVELSDFEDFSRVPTKEITVPEKKPDEIQEWCPRCNTKCNYIINYKDSQCWKCGYPELKPKL